MSGIGDQGLRPKHVKAPHEETEQESRRDGRDDEEFLRKHRTRDDHEPAKPVEPDSDP